MDNHGRVVNWVAAIFVGGILTLLVYGWRIDSKDNAIAQRICDPFAMYHHDQDIVVCKSSNGIYQVRPMEKK